MFPNYERTVFCMENRGRVSFGAGYGFTRGLTEATSTELR
jgi:hypothetical protein